MKDDRINYLKEMEKRIITLKITTNFNNHIVNQDHLLTLKLSLQLLN